VPVVVGVVVHGDVEAALVEPEALLLVIDAAGVQVSGIVLVWFQTVGLACPLVAWVTCSNAETRGSSLGPARGLGAAGGGAAGLGTICRGGPGLSTPVAAAVDAAAKSGSATAAPAMHFFIGRKRIGEWWAHRARSLVTFLQRCCELSQIDCSGTGSLGSCSGDRAAVDSAIRRG
jgi:hypothetical protein